MEIDARIIKYVPKKFQPVVTGAWRDDDGYWLNLQDGYIFSSTFTHVVCQDTIKCLKNDIKTICKED